MYEFHYDYIKNKFDNNSKLFITDTDSLMYEIKIEDVGKDFSSNKSMFDFRNYSDILKNYDNSENCCDWRICWIESKDVFILGR